MKLLIIGGGISGLSAGIRALEKGYSVDIYEKNANAGGCCTGWERDGYYIDNCMHWLTGTNYRTKTSKIWKKIGALSETSNLYQGEYFYKSSLGSSEIALYTDLEKTRFEMLKISPIDKKEINSFINTVKALTKMLKKENYLRDSLLTPFYYFHLIKYYRLSIGELAERFTHPLLKALFSDFLPDTYSSSFLVYAYATFASGDGKVYMEGSKAFAENILKTYIAKGGKIHYNEAITKIILNDEQTTATAVVSKKNEIITCDKIICACDPFYTFNVLLPNYFMPTSYKDKLIERKKYPIYSSYHIAFKVKRDKNPFFDTTLFEIPATTIGKRVITRLMIKDYSYLYKTKESTIVQAFIYQTEEDYDYWASLSKDDYDKKKEEIASKIKDILVKKYACLKNNIEVLDSWTPLTFNKYYNAYYGAYMGFSFTNKSKLDKIPHKIKGLDNVFIASSWQSFVSGLPTAASAGYSLANNIL